MRVLFYPNDNVIVSEAELEIKKSGGHHVTTDRLHRLSATTYELPAAAAGGGPPFGASNGV